MKQSALSEKRGRNGKEQSKKKQGNKSKSRPITASNDYILQLQQTIGNQAVQRMIKSGEIQLKNNHIQAGNVYSREVDRLKQRVESQFKRMDAENQEAAAEKSNKQDQGKAIPQGNDTQPMQYGKKKKELKYSRKDKKKKSTVRWQSWEAAHETWIKYLKGDRKRIPWLHRAEAMGLDPPLREGHGRGKPGDFAGHVLTEADRYIEEEVKPAWNELTEEEQHRITLERTRWK